MGCDVDAGTERSFPQPLRTSAERVPAAHPQPGRTRQFPGTRSDDEIERTTHVDFSRPITGRSNSISEGSKIGCLVRAAHTATVETKHSKWLWFILLHRHLRNCYRRLGSTAFDTLSCLGYLRLNNFWRVFLEVLAPAARLSCSARAMWNAVPRASTLVPRSVGLRVFLPSVEPVTIGLVSSRLLEQQDCQDPASPPKSAANQHEGVRSQTSHKQGMAHRLAPLGICTCKK